MTNTPPESPDNTPILPRLWQFLRRPSTLIIGGTSLVAISTIGYLGVRYFVYEQLSPLLSTQLSKYLKREVNIGAVESFSFNRIRFTSSSLPAARNDPNNISIQAVEVGVNPLPLLIGRPLPIDVKLVKPRVYLEEDKKGQWLRFDVEPPEPGQKSPISLDVNVGIEEARIDVKPQVLVKPVTVKVDGSGRFIDNKNQDLQYDLKADAFNSNIKIKGETAIKLGKTNTELLVEQLDLTRISAILPHSPIKVISGILDTNLSINLPSLEKIKETQGQGQVNINEVKAQYQPLKLPIKINSAISLQGQKVLIDKASASLGDIATNIDGAIDWQKGYDLNVKLNPVNLTQLLKVLFPTLGLRVLGEVKSDLKVTGLLDQPIITGKLQNTKTVVIDKVPLKSVSTDIQTNLNTLNLSNIEIIPAAGGKIVSKGRAGLGILQSLKNNKKIDGTKIPLAFEFTGNLPTREFISPYVQFTRDVSLGGVAVKGTITDSLSKPKVNLNWNLPNQKNPQLVNIYGQGQAQLSVSRLTLSKTRINTDTGTLNLDGEGDFQKKTLRANATSQRFLLTPFLPIACKQIPAGCGYLRALSPISLDSANIKINGKLDKPGLDTLDGVVNLAMRTKTGTITANSTIAQGNIRAVTLAEGLPINPLLGNLPAQVKLVRSQFNFSGSLSQLANNNIQSLNTWQGRGNFLLTVDNQPVNATARIDEGVIRGNVNTTRLALNPFVPNLATPVRLGDSRFNFTGALTPVLKNTVAGLKTWQGNGNLQLFVDGQPLYANAQIDRGVIRGALTGDNIALNPFLPNVTIPVSLRRTQINFESAIEPLLTGKIPNINTLNATANLQLLVDNNPINTRTLLNNGILNSTANIRGVALNGLIPNLPLPVNLSQADINLSGNAGSLLASLGKNQLDLSSFRGVINSQLSVARGKVIAGANLENNRWTSNIVANNLDTSFLLNRLGKQSSPVKLPRLNGIANLAGNVNNLTGGATTIAANSIKVNVGDNRINAAGNILLTNVTGRLDIGSVDLNVSARSNLGSLPIKALVASISKDSPFFPQAVNITGNGSFQGKLRGRQLLTAFAAPGSLRLEGNINLNNFSVNNRIFEPRLQGQLSAGVKQAVAFNLSGKQDVLAATLDPCNRRDCLLPYLPLAFEFKQVWGNQLPLIARGIRQGDRLIANIQDFPLEILNIAPGRKSSIVGVVGGKLNANADINLFNLNGSGQLRINQPSLGNIQGDTIAANVVYRDGLAQLKEGSFKAGRNQVSLAGSYNFRNSQIIANVNVPQGYIEDLFATLNITDVDSVLRLAGVQKLPPVKVARIQPKSVGNPNAPLSEQVNLFAKIQEMVKSLADKRDFVGVPTELDIRGRYRASLAVAGTLKKPQVDVNFVGDKWEWRPQQPTPDIVEPLGLVITDTQLIPIENVTLNASFNRGVLRLNPAKIILKDSLVSLAGDLSLEKLNTKFVVQNLSVDTLKSFVKIPLDIAGNFNTEGQLVGTLFNPQVQGTFSFLDPAINARSINQDITGVYVYNNARLDVRSTSPDDIQFYASVPFPPLPGKNDRFSAQVKLGTGAVELISAITEDEIRWLSGNGGVFLETTGRLDIRDGLKIKDFTANGKLTLDQANLKLAAFPEVVEVNGTIDLTPERLTVEGLQGSIAQRQITVSGILPFFQPIANNPNPLIVAVEKGPINLEGLYRGNLEGQVSVTGTAFKPVIGGGVRLSNGEVLVPRVKQENAPTQGVKKKWLGEKPAGNGGITPQLRDFQVTLDDLFVEQDRLYRFNFGGGLTLNGALTSINNLRSKGAIKLDRGLVAFLNTRFTLNRRHENIIVFNPDRSILNPELDVQMRTILSSFPQSKLFQSQRFAASGNNNEYPDDSLNRVQRVDVTLSVKGQLTQLIPSLGQDVSKVCNVFRNELPFPETVGFTREQLNQLYTCLQTVALNNSNDNQLLSSPIVQLTSSPPRSEGEIIRLLGDQVFALVDSLQSSNTEQLIQFGVVQLAFPLLFQGIVYDVENSISNVVGAADVNILPYLEAVYKVDKTSFVRFSYDYNFNEVRVRYETRF
ncbi:MAG: hypothetical protein N5P05_002218 [Chroococcopsis gigantea SAG 12.99]|jgi:translocation and assembly module TamB|nr:hypothetical protein [Chroococcopsis gigantea SAG 12.99]